MTTSEGDASGVPAGRWHDIQQEYRKSLAAIIKSRPAWLFVAVLLAAVVVLALKGRFDTLLSALPLDVFLLVFTLLTIPLTRGVEQLPHIETHSSRPRLWWQVALLLLVILFVTYRGFALNVPTALRLPLLAPLTDWSFSLFGPRSTVLSNWIAVPVLYCVIPLALLLLLGARWSELGLGRGYRAWRVTLLWCALPVLAIVALVATNSLSFVGLIVVTLGNFLQSGFFEEFLFRGALMTRLNYLLHDDWGVVLSALIFGLFHIGVQTSALHGDWLAGAAAAIVNQAVFGAAMAIIVLRTRNLLASSVFHVIINTF